MKKTFTLLTFFFLFSTILISQTYFYRLYKISSFDLDENGNILGDETVIETTGIISFSEEQHKITIDFTEDRLIFSLVEKEKIVEGTDSDGDKFIRHIYKAIDEDVLRCMITVESYVNFNNTYFYIRYNNVIFVYHSSFIQYKEKEKKTAPKENPVNVTKNIYTQL